MGWKYFLDMIDEDDEHFLGVLGYSGESHPEAIWVELGESGKKDGSTWPPMRWQHICITYDKATGIQIPSPECGVLDSQKIIYNPKVWRVLRGQILSFLKLDDATFTYICN